MSLGLLAEMGEMDLTLDNCLASLRIKKWVLGGKHLLTARVHKNIAHNNIAGVLACNFGAIGQAGSDSDLELEETKHLQKAMNLHKKALKLIVNNVGKQILLTAKTYDNIASICRRLREWDKAMNINREVLRVKQVSVGESHLSLVVTHSSMAMILHRQKKVRWHHTKSLKIRETTVGHHHRSVRSIHSAMTSVLGSKVADIQKQARHWEKFGSKEGSSTFNKMSGLLQLHSERVSDTLSLQDAPNYCGFELDNLENSLEWDDIEVMLEKMVKLKVFS